MFTVRLKLKLTSRYIFFSLHHLTFVSSPTGAARTFTERTRGHRLRTFSFSVKKYCPPLLKHQRRSERAQTTRVTWPAHPFHMNQLRSVDTINHCVVSYYAKRLCFVANYTAVLPPICISRWSRCLYPRPAPPRPDPTRPVFSRWLMAQKLHLRVFHLTR